MKKLNCLLLIFILIFTFTITSYAVDYNLTDVDVIDISQYEDEDVLNVSGEVEITDSAKQSKDISIVCAEGTKLTLNEVEIETNGRVCPITFTGDNNELIIKGSSTIDSYYFTSTNYPGIQCDEGSTLIISGNETAVLNVKSCDERPAIGGLVNSGHIIINSGNIDALGGDYAAVIGGGRNGNGEVTINGGNLTLKAESYGNGLGSGDGGESNVNINGGEIEILGNIYSKGICDDNETNTSINITSGKLIVNYTAWGYGIGNIGQGLANINITGGEIYIYGYYGAVISNNGEINISGDSSVTLEGLGNNDLGALESGNVDIKISGTSTVNCENRIYTNKTIEIFGNAEVLSKEDIIGDVINVYDNALVGIQSTSYKYDLGYENSNINIYGNSVINNIKSIKGNEINIYGSSKINLFENIDGNDINIFHDETLYGEDGEKLPNLTCNGTIGNINSNINIYKNSYVDVKNSIIGNLINIYDNAQIISQGNSSLPGIGSAPNGSTTVNVYGNADVNATGGTWGAGIGGADQSINNTINIYDDANIKAYGNIAAGIGGGCESTTNTINIQGNVTVYAEGGTWGAGIGGANVSNINNITIGGCSNITAIGNTAAGIGGYHNSENNINISEDPSINVSNNFSSYYDIGYGSGVMNISGGTIYTETIGYNEASSHINIKGNCEIYVDDELDGLVNISENSVVFLKTAELSDDASLNNHIIETPASSDVINMYNLPIEWSNASDMVILPKGKVIYLGNGNTGGTAPVDSEEYENGDEIAVLDNTDLVNEGYDFDGWIYGEDILAANDKFYMGDYSISLKANWDPRDDTLYKTEHYKYNYDNGIYELADTDNMYGTTESTVQALSKDYDGYIENESYYNRIPEGIVKGDGSLVLKLYYTAYDFDVTFDKNTDDEVNELPEKQKLFEGEKAAEPADPSRLGYEFDGWFKENGCLNQFIFAEEDIASNITLFAKWNANNDTKYTVKHLKEKITLDGYVETDIDDLTGTSGALVKGVPKEYTGFNLKESVSGNILGDGTLVLNMYYDKKEFDVTYNKNTEDNVTGMPSTESVHYELNATKPDGPGREGYSFDGWYKETNCTNEWNFDTDTVTQDTIIYAKWIESEKEVVNYINEVDFTMSYEGGISEAHKTGDIFMLSDGMSLSKEGYILSGWAYESNTYLLGALYEMPGNNVKMNPVWLKDSDNDGLSDDEEVAAGTDPFNDQDKPHKGNISIKIVESNGKPIEGITCILNSAPIIQHVNSDGLAVFNDVDMSKHTLTLVDENEILGKFEFNLSKGENNLTSIISDDNVEASISDDSITLEILIEKATDGTLKISNVGLDEKIIDEISTDDESEESGFNYLWIMPIVIIIAIAIFIRKMIRNE